MYIDAKREDFLTDMTLAMSFAGNLPDVREDSICIAPVALRERLFESLKGACFYIAPMSFDTGISFCVRDVRSQFSFTENFESIIKTLTLTICGVVKYYRRVVRQNVFKVIFERAKNVVRSTAPRFLRL